MSDGIFVTVILSVKPDASQVFRSKLRDMVPETSTFAGFRSIRILRNAATPDTLIAIEHWDSMACFEAYRNWRVERGETDIDGILDGPPRFDIWSAVVAMA